MYTYNKILPKKTLRKKKIKKLYCKWFGHKVRDEGEGYWSCDRCKTNNFENVIKLVEHRMKQAERKLIDMMNEDISKEFKKNDPHE